MNDIDRRIELYRRYKELARGAAMRRLSLAKGFSVDHGVWELAVVEYLAEGVSSEDFIAYMLNDALPARCIRRQIELSVGLEIRVLPCPVSIDVQDVVISAFSGPVEGYRA